MLLLVMTLIYWTQAEGVCYPGVSISGGNKVVSAGEAFTLSCTFTCLTSQHVAQLRRDDCRAQDNVSMVSVTSALPDITVALSISSAAPEHSGPYCCMTHTSVAISPSVFIQVSDNLATETSTLTTPSTPKCGSAQQSSSAAGLQGQMWFWMLVGKSATLLLLGLTWLAVKYYRG